MLTPRRSGGEETLKIVLEKESFIDDMHREIALFRNPPDPLPRRHHAARAYFTRFTGASLTLTSVNGDSARKISFPLASSSAM